MKNFTKQLAVSTALMPNHLDKVIDGRYEKRADPLDRLFFGTPLLTRLPLA